MWQLLSSTNQDNYTSHNVEFESSRMATVNIKMLKEEENHKQRGWGITVTENGFIARGDDNLVVRYEMVEEDTSVPPILGDR